MLTTLVSLTALLSAVLLMLLGNGLLGSLLGLKLTQAGAGPLASALVMSGYYAGLVAGAFRCTRIIQQVGHIRAFAAFCAINVATTLLLSLTEHTAAWVLLRFVTGLSMMGAYMVIESWLNERAEASMRGRVFSIYMVVSYTGLGGGQFLLSFSDGTATLFTLAALLFALCLLPIVLTRAVVPQPMTQVKLNMRELFQRAPHAIYACLAAGLVNGAFYALGPVYAFAQAGTASLVGVFMGLTIFGGLALQWPLGLLSDLFKRRLIMQLLGLSLAVISLLQFSVHNLSLELAIATLWGGLAFTIYPVAVAYANDRISPEELVPTAAVLLMTYSGGAALGPILAGLAMRTAGVDGLYLFTSLIALCMVLLVARRRGAEHISTSDQGNFIPVPRTSTVITQLDPRADEAALQEENG